MQENQTTGKANARRPVPHMLAVFGNPRALCLAALLAAMSLILGKFLQIPTPFSALVRISFENLPVVLSGLLLGPLAGAMTGAVADLVGCLLYGYSINPLVTLGAAAVGLMAGAASLVTARLPLLVRLISAELAAHVVGSLFIKTAGLAAWYLAEYNMGYWQLFLWRVIAYSIISVLEITLLYLLLRHRGVARQLERMCRK